MLREKLSFFAHNIVCIFKVFIYSIGRSLISILSSDILLRCFEDSDKLVKSTQKETIDEIKEEIKEVKSSSLAEIMKQELEKSLDGMANEIETVKSTLNETKTDAAEARDRENRRNNIVVYRLHESDTHSTEDRKNKILKHVLISYATHWK